MADVEPRFVSWSEPWSMRGVEEVDVTDLPRRTPRRSCRAGAAARCRRSGAEQRACARRWSVETVTGSGSSWTTTRWSRTRATTRRCRRRSPALTAMLDGVGLVATSSRLLSSAGVRAGPRRGDVADGEGAADLAGNVACREAAARDGRGEVARRRRGGVRVRWRSGPAASRSSSTITTSYQCRPPARARCR